MIGILINIIALVALFLWNKHVWEKEHRDHLEMELRWQKRQLRITCDTADDEFFTYIQDHMRVTRGVEVPDHLWDDFWWRNPDAFPKLTESQHEASLEYESTFYTEEEDENKMD